MNEKDLRIIVIIVSLSVYFTQKKKNEYKGLELLKVSNMTSKFSHI